MVLITVAAPTTLETVFFRQRFHSAHFARHDFFAFLRACKSCGGGLLGLAERIIALVGRMYRYPHSAPVGKNFYLQVILTSLKKAKFESTP